MINQLLAGRYQVLQVLGAGGFGKTYIVEDIHLPGRPKCVLKHLSPASSESHVLEIARRLFQKEAETLQQLGNHDQIPRLLAYFEENQEFYLVQEFINGHTLSQELPHGQKLTQSQIMQMLLDILQVLKFVHSQAVIHRDIKPDNIIRRTADNKLVLIDFGAIKQVRNQSLMAESQVSVSVVIGTPGYMPTEQSRGTPRPNSDIYALGMIAIQALTGLYPYELPEDHQTGEILWQHLVSASPGLVALLQKMTCYHFKDRYQNADEALAALQTLINPVIHTSPTASNKEITLEWLEAGQIRTQTISNHQPSKNPGTVRIGRDSTQCDIVLSEPSVSGLHIEIFFNPQQQSFYLRSLRPNNPPLVNGRSLATGEVVLTEGSSIRLGQLNLLIKTFKGQQHAASYTPTQYVTQAPNSVPQPIAETLQAQPSGKWQQKTIPVAPVNPIPVLPAPTPTSRSKLPLFIGVGVAAAVSFAGFAITKNASTSSSNVALQKSCFVIVGGNVRSAPTSSQNNVITTVSGEKLKITGKQTPKGWIQVQLTNESLGWTHQDIISNQDEMNNCVQKNHISLQTVDDISSPTQTIQTTEEKPTPTPTDADYQKGFQAGSARGEEIGKEDGSATPGRAMHIQATCTGVPGSAEYVKGFINGCKPAYKKAFQAAKEKAQVNEKTPSEPSDNNEKTPSEPSDNNEKTLSESSDNNEKTPSEPSDNNEKTLSESSDTISCTAGDFSVKITPNQNGGYTYTAYNNLKSKTTPSLVLQGEKQVRDNGEIYTFNNGDYSYEIFKVAAGRSGKIYLNISESEKQLMSSPCN